jgi:hypothetical protein
LNTHRFNRAIPGTRSALHARIPVPDFNPAIDRPQDGMGADQQAHPATHAFFLMEFQRDDILQISQWIHE